MRSRNAVLFALGLAALLALAYSPLVFGGRFLYYGDIRDNHVWRQTLGWMGQQHRLIWWSPWEFSGMSTVGDIQKGMLYPLSWPFYCLPMGPAYTIYSLLHVWLAGLGLYLLGRALGLRPLPAALSGVSFALGSFMICHLDETPVMGVVTWLPWLVWCLLRCLETGQPRWWAGGAVAFALECCGGHVQFVYYSGLLAMIVLLAWGIRYRNGRRPLLALLLFAGGVMLAAPQLLPFAAAARQCPRHGGMTYAFCTSYCLTPRMLWTLVSPFSQGGPSPRADEEEGPCYRALERATDTVQEPYQGDWSLGEVCLYPGLAVFMLAAAGLGSGRRLAWILLAGIGVSIWIGLGPFGSLHRVVYTLVPGFSYFRAPSRLGLFVSLGFSLLAGLGLQALLDGRVRKWWPAAVGGVLLALLYRAPGHEIAGPLAAMAAVALVLLALPLLNREAWRPLATALILLAVGTDLLVYCQGYIRTSPESSLHPKIPALEELSRAPGLFRLVFGTDPRIRGSMVSDLMSYGLQSVQGDNAMVPLRYVQFLVFNEGGHFPPPGPAIENLSVNNYLFIMQNVPSRLLELANAWAYLTANDKGVWAVTDGRALDRYWFAPRFEVDDGEHALARVQSGEVDPRTTVLLADPPPAGAGGIAPGHLADVRYDFDRTDLRVEAPGPGFVCTSEVYDPGWHATVDGQEVPVLRAFYTFMAVPVGPGTHTVAWRYWPVGFTPGLILSGLTTLVLAAACWRGRR